MSNYLSRKVTVKVTKELYDRLFLLTKHTTIFRQRSLSWFLRDAIIRRCDALEADIKNRAAQKNQSSEQPKSAPAGGPTKEAGIQSPKPVRKSRKRS